MFKTLLTARTKRFPDNTPTEVIERELNQLFLELENNPKVQSFEVYPHHTQYYLIYDILVKVTP